MNTVSLIGSVSRRAGGLFESVRRLHQELLRDCAGLGQTSKPPGLDGLVNIRVLGIRDEFTAQDSPAWDPVPVTALSGVGWSGLSYAPSLGRILRKAQPDLVHVHGLWQYASLATVRWHRRSGRPYLVSPHGMLDRWALSNAAWKKKLAWLAYEGRHLSQAGCIRALCQSEAESIRGLGLRNPVCLIPNGIDLPLREPSRPIEGKLNTGSTRSIPRAKKLLYLGRIHPKKGLGALLRAWTRAERPREWVLIIAGWDQLGHEKELKKLAGELGIDWADSGEEQANGASVMFVGPRFGKAKQECLAECEAMILPSLSEGLPMAILEAWANAKPVLITGQCNLPEGLNAGAAIAIEPETESIVAGLEQLFQRGDLELKSMGRRGRDLVASKFAWPKIVKDLKAVYYWLGRGGARPACVLEPR